MQWPEKISCTVNWMFTYSLQKVFKNNLFFPIIRTRQERQFLSVPTSSEAINRSSMPPNHGDLASPPSVRWPQDHQCYLQWLWSPRCALGSPEEAQENILVSHVFPPILSLPEKVDILR